MTIKKIIIILYYFGLLPKELTQKLIDKLELENE